MNFITAYNFIDSGKSRTCGWYLDKSYTTINRANSRIKKLKKMLLLNRAKELEITLTQARTLQYKVFKLKNKIL